MHSTIRRFQSLIGTLQTKPKEDEDDEIYSVSIPYRYATNILGEVTRGCVDFQFQSLIGTLQTHSKKICQSETSVFQSLIGTLQTCRNLNRFRKSNSFNPLQVRYKPAYERERNRNRVCFNPLQVRYKRVNICTMRIYSVQFQSLIGTLQTLPKLQQTRLAKVVSIPYRYATNTGRRD